MVEESEVFEATEPDALPTGGQPAMAPGATFQHVYTTGPFQLPPNAGSLDWIVMNNDPTTQDVRVTVFQAGVGVPKAPAVPGPLVVSVGPGAVTHNANTYPTGYVYEIQVETNSRMVFPYVSVWPGNFGEAIPGTAITSGSFLELMPATTHAQAGPVVQPLTASEGHPMFAATVVQQPQPNDIVGRRIQVGGLATAVEATIQARVRDATGQELVATFTHAGGGMGEIGQFHVELEVPVRPATPHGFVEVFEHNAAYPGEGPYGSASEVNKVVVPVVFGTNLVEAYVGYRHHLVGAGDTLAKIALAEYGDADRWPILFDANRDQIGDPDLIFHGQRLRVPHLVGAPTTTVDVYFVHMPNYVAGTQPDVVAAARSVPAAAPARGALEELFAGPTAAERANGLEVVRSGATGFRDLSIDAGIARVTLEGGCDSGGSTMTIANLITPTLKQFATVDHVKIHDPAGHTDSPQGPTDSLPACLEP
jgi:hypothetical protein